MDVLKALAIFGDLSNVLLLMLILLGIWYWLRTPRNLPPGPIGWPLLGFIPNMGWRKHRTGLESHEIFTQLSKEYGEVVSLYMGQRLVVVLNSYAAIKEAFNNSALLGRPQSAILDDVVIARGIATASGESWKQQRKFTQTTFRSFGVGKSKFEEQIITEAEVLLQDVESTNEKAFDFRHHLGNAVSNIICVTVFGKRYDYNDKNFKRLLDIVYRQFILLGSGALNLFVPIMRYLQPGKQEQLRKNYCELYKFTGNIIEEHKQDFDSDHLNDYIDVYLNEIEIGKKLGRESHISDKTAVASVGNLFGAGTDTTANTLYWGLLFLLQHPEIQARLHDEMDQVVGRNRMPRYSDKTDLPFTTATIMEISRHASVVPFGVPHAATENTTLKGFSIPDGTILLANLWAVMHNPDVWDEPEVFRPERFLDADGKIYQKDEFIPFGIGKRFCPGENLAKMELFIFFTHLLHRFTFKKETDTTQLDLSSICGASKFPHPFKVRAVRRE